jgi:long-subunit acyl-CoA synthetase (AMP-forming)
LKRIKSCGKTIKGVEVLIKKSLEPFTVGEILIRGPNGMLGIYKNEYK